MKTKWIIVGVGVLVVAGVVPWATGYVTEQQWQQVTRELNQSQSLVQVQTGHYNRGILGSELDGVVTVLNPESGEHQKIEYHADVTHGLTGSYMDFEPVHGWQPEDADWFQEQPGLTLESRLWGTAVLELEVPATAISNAESGESIRASGGVARVEVSDAGSQVDALLVWPQLSFSGPDMAVRVNDFRFEQSMTHLNGDIWVGDMDGKVASTELTPAGQPPITLEGFTANSRMETKDNGGRLGSRLTIAAEQLRLEDEAYGPHKLTFALEDLDVESWSGLTTGMAELQEIALQASDSGDRKAFQQQVAVMGQINTAMRNLAAAGFSVAVPELAVTTPEGEISGSAEIRHPELVNDQSMGMLMMQRLVGEMNLSIPAKLADNYPVVRMQLAPLVKQGLLVPEGDQLVLAAQLSDMVVDVNGREIPLPPIL